MMAAARSISGGGGEARRGKPLMAQAIDKKPERGARVCISIVYRVIERTVQMWKLALNLVIPEGIGSHQHWPWVHLPQ